MPSAIPYTLHEMPRIYAEEDDGLSITLHLGALLTHQFPAFIIAAPEDERPVSPWKAENMHHDRLRYIARLIGGWHGNHDAISYSRVDLDTSQSRYGLLHTDTSSSDAPHPTTAFTIPEVHTTVASGGDVYMSYVGSDPEFAYRFAHNQRDRAYQDMATKFHLGEVFPEIIDPNVYRGRVQTGDSVVWSGASGRFAAWHRFDTDSDPTEREAIIGKLHWATPQAEPRGMQLV